MGFLRYIRSEELLAGKIGSTSLKQIELDRSDRDALPNWIESRNGLTTIRSENDKPQLLPVPPRIMDLAIRDIRLSSHIRWRDVVVSIVGYSGTVLCEVGCHAEISDGGEIGSVGRCLTTAKDVLILSCFIGQYNHTMQACRRRAKVNAHSLFKLLCGPFIPRIAECPSRL